MMTSAANSNKVTFGKSSVTCTCAYELTCNIELCARFFSLHNALEQTFVLRSDVEHLEFAQTTVGHLLVLDIVDVDNLKKTHPFT